MELIDYSPSWEQIFSLPLSELLKLDLDSFCEEDLDPIAIRLKHYAEFDEMYNVHEAMLQRDMSNPCVSYYNLFEKLIIRYMSLRDYNKARSLLFDYHSYDEKERSSYRRGFILRNVGICEFSLGNEEKGKKIIDELILSSPQDYFNYYDIALEFDRLGYLKECLFYLKEGLESAKRFDDKAWYPIFESQIKELG